MGGEPAAAAGVERGADIRGNPGKSAADSGRIEEQIAVGDLSGSWFVLNSDFATMPTNADFDLLALDPSPNAWIHEATAATLSGSSTRIDHPLLDGNACAQMLVTPTVFGPLDVHPVGVRYDGAHWNVDNQDGAAMPAGAVFHLLVDPGQAEPCGLLFADDFESGNSVEWSTTTG